MVFSMIHVKFFASVRERVGTEDLHLPSSKSSLTVAEVLTLVEEQTQTKLGDTHLLASINHQHASFTDPVADEDEVAFFPPVTGG